MATGTALPARRVDCHAVVELSDRWELARAAPGGAPSEWRAALVPGTVAQSLGIDLDTPGRYDADDWWYRCRFAASASSDRRYLRFEGLATLAQVWLNGQLILDACNMFRAHEVEVGALLQADNELRVCLRSLDHELAQRRPRPRWKTALIEQQNLRWVRTTLLGRMPGWTPPIHPVGIFGTVRLETRSRIEVREFDLQAHTHNGCATLRLRSAYETPALQAARLHLGEQVHALAVAPGRIDADLTLPDVPLWWPHTHGTPALLDCALELQVDGEWVRIRCGRVGFKEVRVERAGQRVQLHVNGVPVFCRGAVWTCDDLIALHSDATRLRRTLELARDAGLNMLRVGGTMTYESDAFYALCNELGILVWQEFMFANMDYPVADAAFRAEIEAEATYQLQRLQSHACMAVYCGGSEVEQQAAMLGLPAGEWSNDFHAQALPALCERWHAGIAYFASSPCEGALPFHVATGIAHYYGVGAYRRPLSDVKHAGVKFATECLGFANLPDAQTVELLHIGSDPAPHHPLWKQRQPRDMGAGWDFEDIRDHYLKLLFGIDPIALRSQDLPRYHALSRVVSGEVMRRTYAEWRTPGNLCGGALVWNYKDLWPGAGWGIVDSTGRPKPAYWHLKRAWATRAVYITDEGLDGLRLHVVNETDSAWQATLELALYQSSGTCIARAQAPVRAAPRAGATLQADALLGRFADTAYAYRFGPPQHDVTHVRLMTAEGELLAEDFHFPLGLDLPRLRAAAWQGQAHRRDDGNVVMTLSSACFLQSVQIECAGYSADDAYFHVAPHSPRSIVLRPLDPAPRKFKAHVSALNVHETVTLRAD